MKLYTLKPTFEDLDLSSTGPIHCMILTIRQKEDSSFGSTLIINEADCYSISESNEIVLSKIKKQYPHMIVINHLLINSQSLTYIEEDLYDKSIFYFNFGAIRHKIHITNVREMISCLLKYSVIGFYHKVKTLTGTVDQYILLNMFRFLKTSITEPHRINIHFINESNLLWIYNPDNNNVLYNFHESLMDYRKQKVILDEL